jgi:propanol-preferring alcohol dehydrogenase
MSIPYWGSRVELVEVIAMARADRIHARTTEFSTHDGRGRLYEAEGGQITGRAVLIPASIAARMRAEH